MNRTAFYGGGVRVEEKTLGNLTIGQTAQYYGSNSYFPHRAQRGFDLALVVDEARREPRVRDLVG